MRFRFLIAPILLLGCLAVQPCLAQEDQPEAAKLLDDIHETIVRVPVTVTLENGRQHAGRIVLTHYRPDGNGPFPVVVINHGRTAEREKRGEVARFRFTGIARYFIRRGFAVLVPTRLGYGDAGLDPDPEFGGDCNTRNNQPGMAAFVQETEAVLGFAKTLPWADPGRVVLFGQSYGGLGTIAAAGKNPPGVMAGINFGGGAGGNPKARPERPCSPEGITSVMKEAGGHARVSTLWLYAENDRFWGKEWPRRWYAAYAGAGGRGEFSSLPPVGADGHQLLFSGFTLWRPLVDRFLDKAGFPPPRSKDAPPSSGFARLDDAGKIPFVKDDVKNDGYQKFLNADVPRAFVISPSGAWSWRRGVDAPKLAMEACQKVSRTPCRLYAVDDAVVWTP